MRCWLGIDVGTSGIKVIIMSESGKVLGQGYEELYITVPQTGYAEQDPMMWWKACKSAVKQAVQKSGAGSRVAAIGFSGQMQGTVFLDAHNQLIRNCIIWMDQRAVEEVKDIEQRLVEQKVDALAITANNCLNTFWAPKILWMQKHEPENYEKINKVIFPKDYLAYRMTGEIATEVSDCSLTFLLDVPGRKWSEKMFQALGIPQSFVPKRLLESCEITGNLLRSVAEEVGLTPGIPVIAGGGDQTANGIGTGIIEETVLGASIGTSAVVFGCGRKPFVDYQKKAIQSLCHSVPHLWSYLGLSLTAGASLKWIRDNLFADKKQILKENGIDVYDYITDIAAGANPGCDGVIFLPYLNGDSAPNNNANARGGFFGLSLNTGMPELCRSVMEGVAYSLNETVEIYRSFGKKVDTVRVSGGGAKSKLWRQIQADIFNAKIVTMNIEEGPAAGAAIMAGVGSGFWKSVEEGCNAVLRIATETDPVYENVKRYQEYFRLYQSMHGYLEKAFEKRAQLVAALETGL